VTKKLVIVMAPSHQSWETQNFVVSARILLPHFEPSLQLYIQYTFIIHLWVLLLIP